jgi:hypothetical protein
MEGALASDIRSIGASSGPDAPRRFEEGQMLHVSDAARSLRSANRIEAVAAVLRTDAVQLGSRRDG